MHLPSLMDPGDGLMVWRSTLTVLVLGKNRKKGAGGVTAAAPRVRVRERVGSPMHWDAAPRGRQGGVADAAPKGRKGGCYCACSVFETACPPSKIRTTRRLIVGIWMAPWVDSTVSSTGT